MRNHGLLTVLVFLACTACQMRPPVQLSSGLRVSPEMELVRPSDIAVLPVEDATPDRSFGVFADVLRQRVAAALVERYYAPLSNVMVDQALSARGEVQRGSPVDASYVSRVAGVFEEDAVLGLRVLEWDPSTIMKDERVRFSVDVLLLASDGHKLLWSGRLDGDVKSGGDGPAPLQRPARIRSAVEVFADALVAELPARRM